MSAGAVTTVSANALLVAQQYRSQKWLGALSAFRACFYEHLDEIQETPGMHKAWKKVSPDAASEWPGYERLEVVAPPSAPAPALPTPSVAAKKKK